MKKTIHINKKHLKKLIREGLDDILFQSPHFYAETKQQIDTLTIDAMNFISGRVESYSRKYKNDIYPNIALNLKGILYAKAAEKIQYYMIEEARYIYSQLKRDKV